MKKYNFYLFGKRIKELRKSKEMTQEELADLLDVTKVSVCGYERGTRSPSIDKLVAISEIFNVSLDYLLGREIKVENKEVRVSSQELHILAELKKHDKLFCFLQNRTEQKINVICDRIKKIL